MATADAATESDIQEALPLPQGYSPDQRELAAVVSGLRSTYGARWADLPLGYGVRAARASQVLSTGLVPVDPDTADPVRLPQELAPLVNETADIASRLLKSSLYLGDALGVSLEGMSLWHLARVCNAVRRLSEAPPLNPLWARPASAATASFVFDALGEDLREVAAIRQELYRHFTEDIWLTDSARDLPIVDRWWQAPRRQRVKADLAAVARVDREPMDAKVAIAKLRRAAELSAGIDQASGAVSGHLGWSATSGIPDVDGAIAALSAVMELHEALGEQLDETTLRDLAAADAFVSDELLHPANDILRAIDGWASHTRGLRGAEPMAYSPIELRQWAAQTGEALEVLETLRQASSPLRVSACSAGQVFDDAVQRDRVRYLCELVSDQALGRGDEG